MVELRTFGGLSLQANGAACIGAAAQRKTLALLALLAQHPRGLSRDKLIAYLWPETDAEHGRSLLRQACYALRRDLNEDKLLLGSTELRLNPAVLTSDVQAFDDALQRGELARAVDGYRGPFLDGFYLSEAPEFERWVDAERAQLAKQFSDALATLAKEAAARGDHRGATDWWRRLTALDPLSSHAALGLMTALVAAGESAEAIKHARAHEAFLQQEMGTAPHGAVLALVKQLCEEAERGASASGAEQQRRRRQSTTDFLLAALPAALRRELRRTTTLSTVAAALAIVLVVGAVGIGVSGRHVTTSEPEPLPVADRKMLAVLPLENQGAPGDEYFADGLSEAITARLGSVRGLGVIGWRSSRQYKGTRKRPQEIGRELGAQYLLEGTVRWEKPQHGPSAVRVSPALIRVSDGAQVWASQYDTVLAGVFAVEADLATRVTGALDIALADAERRVLEARPTASLQAYDAYLRGREVTERDWDAADLRTAARMFEQAVALDSSFALAHAWLSATYVTMYWNYVDRSPEQLTRAKAEADRAQRLNPDSYEAHGAMGFYYYHAVQDYTRALAEYAHARRRRPNDPWPAAIISGIKQDQGNWSEALAYGREAVSLDPLNAAFVAGMGSQYTELRQYAAADSYYARALALDPASVSARLTRALGHLNLTGDLAGTQRLLPDVARNIAPTGVEDQVTTLGDLVTLLDDPQQTRLLRLTPAALDGDTAALALAKAMVYRGKRQLSLANDHFDFARITLERKVRQEPDDRMAHALLGLALAGLGRSADAIHAGERAVALMPVSTSAPEHALLVANLARIYVLLGERDKAIEQLETVFSRPGPLSANWLRADPFWDPLRGGPRFRRLAGASN